MHSHKNFTTQCKEQFSQYKTKKQKKMKSKKPSKKNYQEKNPSINGGKFYPWALWLLQFYFFIIIILSDFYMNFLFYYADS